MRENERVCENECERENQRVSENESERENERVSENESENECESYVTSCRALYTCVCYSGVVTQFRGSDSG